MKTILHFLIMVFIPGVVLCQSNSAEPKAHWQIGLDVLPIIDTGYTIPSTVLIRKNTGNNSNIRCRLGISFKNIINRPNPDQMPETNSIVSRPFRGYFSLGKEWYSNEKIVSIFWGGEGFVSYWKDFVEAKTDTRPYANPPTIVHEIISYKSVRLGLKGLVGANIRILPSLYCSIESFLETSYRWERGNYEKYEFEEMRLTAYGGRTIKRFIVDIQPISALHIIYAF